MSILESLITTAGDEAKAKLKDELLERIQGAKAQGEQAISELGKNIEEWLKLTIEDELDKDELKALLQAEKRKQEQYLNTLEIKARAQLEKYSVQLVDMVLDKALGKIV